MTKNTNKFLQKNKSTLLMSCVILLIVFGWFYWFQFRPAQIRKKCAESADKITGDRYLGKERKQVFTNGHWEEEDPFEFHKEVYELCLKRNGLTK